MPTKKKTTRKLKSTVMPSLSDKAFFGRGYDSLSSIEKGNVRAMRRSPKKWGRNDVREMAPNRGKAKNGRSRIKPLKTRKI